MIRVRISLFTVLTLLSLETYAEEVDLSGFDDEPVAVVQETTSGDDALMDGFDDETVASTQEKTTADDGLMDGFDDTPAIVTEEQTSTDDAALDGFEDEVPVSTEVEEEEARFLPGLTGEITEQVAYSLHNDKPHNSFSSLKSSLFLDYEHKFENGFRFKVNAKAYYDAIYAIKGRDRFTQSELNVLESEIEIFDAFIEGSITENFDMKLGRQVVVWGRSDTLRVTDILNPLDNRRPGLVDIEDLRLPVTMAKFDYFIGDWRITPIAILEQRFSKRPPFGSAFYPLPLPPPGDEEYSDVTYALSVGAEFSGWDVNFYAARIRDDEGKVVFLPKPSREHEKVNMFGTAINALTGSWLFKTELAYFDGLNYTTTGDKKFTRTDLLLGVEYNGIADTVISFDTVNRHFGNYDDKLLTEINPLNKHSYQHAFRVSSDFMHATLTANYLISLYGEKLDKGGFQRAWIKYELGEGINTNIGLVDYIGGSIAFDAYKDNDMVFADISYNF